MKIKKTSRFEVLDIGHPVPRKQLKGMKVGDEVQAEIDGRKVVIGKITAMYNEYDNNLGFDSCDVKINIDELENVPLNSLAVMSDTLLKSKKRKGQISLRVGQKKAVGIVKKFNGKKWLTSQTVKMYIKKVE